MISYNNILDSIRKCNGGIISIINDQERCNQYLILSILNNLKTEYVIETPDIGTSYEDIYNIILTKKK